MAGLIEEVFGEAGFDDEFVFPGGPDPYEDGVGGGLSEHRPVGQADGIAVVMRRGGERQERRRTMGLNILLF